MPLHENMLLILGSLAAFMLGLLTGLLFWYRSKSRLENENTGLKIGLAAAEKELEAESERLRWKIGRAHV